MRFRAAGLRNARGLALGMAGLALLALMPLCLFAPLNAAFGPRWGALLGRSFRGFFVIALWPAVIRRFAGRVD